MASTTKSICILVRKGKEEESWIPLPRSSRFKNIGRENWKMLVCNLAAWGSGSLWVWQGRWIIILGGRNAFSPCCRALYLGFSFLFLFLLRYYVMLPVHSVYTDDVLLVEQKCRWAAAFCEMYGSMMADGCCARRLYRLMWVTVGRIYPKFHCELKHIERFWSHNKQ